MIKVCFLTVDTVTKRIERIPHGFRKFRRSRRAWTKVSWRQKLEEQDGEEDEARDGVEERNGGLGQQFGASFVLPSARDPTKSPLP